MLPILLPARRITVDGGMDGRVVTIIRHACRPLRPFIPIVCGVDFDLVGLEKKNPNASKEGVKLWVEDVFLPATLFSESFDSLFKLDVPSFYRDDELILVVRNMSKGPRQFSCAWLVEDERRS